MSRHNKACFLAVLKLFSVFILSIAFFVGLYYLFKSTGWLGNFESVEELKKIIQGAGFYSYSIFVLIQFLQVTILPIPGIVTTIVGVILFGPVIAFFLSLLAILLGSISAYFIGKVLGIKVLNWAIGKEKTEVLQNKLKKGKYVFFLMMLFPFFPDDILCILAGVINMDFKFFLNTNLITRTIGIFSTCFLGSFTQFLF